MASSHAPVNLPQLVLLPATEADLIDEVLEAALRREQAPSSKGDESQSEEGARVRQEIVRHQNSLGILRDAVSPSPSHLWHFLDSLGGSLARSADVDVCLRGLLLLHGFLRASGRAQFSEVVKTLLGSSAQKQGQGQGQGQGQSVASGGKPQLDLLALSQGFQLPLAQRQDAAQNRLQNPAVGAARLYAKFLLQRLATSRFVFLPVTKPRSAPGSGSGSSPADAVDDLTEGYWSRLSDGALLQQVQALQRLQEGVVSCGSACGRWLQQAHASSAQAQGLGREAWAVSAGVVLRVVLEVLLRDSFSLFSAINYGLMELIERIGKIPRDQALRALELCRASEKQGQGLSDLYGMLGSLGVGRGVTFPTVATMGDSYLSSLEQFVTGEAPQGNSGSPSDRAGTQNSVILYQPDQAQPQPAAQPAPQPAAPSYVQVAAAVQYEQTSQALFGKYAPPPTPLPTAGVAAGAPAQGAGPGAGVGGGAQLVPYAPAPAKAAWELALEGSLGSTSGVPSAAPPSQAPAAPGPQTHPQYAGAAYLTSQTAPSSMYQTPGQAHAAPTVAMQQQQVVYQQVQQQAAHAAITPWIPRQSMDPFAASARVEPPSYVQMNLRARAQLAGEMQKRLMSNQAQVSLALQSEWNTNGMGVQYGNVLVPF